MFPCSSIMPARLETPMRVPIVSNMSMKRKVKTQMTMSSERIFDHSNFSRMGAMLGGVSTTPFSVVMPRGMPMMVVTMMPMSSAPVTLRTISTAEKMMPKHASSTPGVCRSPKATRVASLLTTMPADFKPIRAMNSPIPGEMALRSTSGMASTIFWRRPVSVSSMKMRPSRNTAVSANCHV